MIICALGQTDFDKTYNDQMKMKNTAAMTTTDSVKGADQLLTMAGYKVFAYGDRYIKISITRLPRLIGEIKTKIILKKVK